MPTRHRYAFQQTYTSPCYCTMALTHAPGPRWCEAATSTSMRSRSLERRCLSRWAPMMMRMQPGAIPAAGRATVAVDRATILCTYTSTVGNSAELTFSGTKFTLHFTKDSNRGSIDVYVDGNKITTIDAYSACVCLPANLHQSHLCRMATTRCVWCMPVEDRTSTSMRFK